MNFLKNKNMGIVLGVTLGAILVAGITATTLTSAQATGPATYLTIKHTMLRVQDLSKMDVLIKVAGNVPMDGSAGAFGYAVLTDGLNNVMVLVTHLGIDDSSHEDPVSGFHTHVLDLMAASANCAGFDLEVDLAGSAANSAFDADYNWKIKDKLVRILSVPTEDLGDAGAEGIVAFTVTPVFDGDTLTNLCVDVI